MKNRRKLKRGQKVKYCGKLWTVCKGGYYKQETKSHLYHLCRGSWHRYVPGNCIHVGGK